MSQLDFIRSKKDDIVAMLEKNMSSSRIAGSLLNTYDYEPTSLSSFERGVRVVVSELKDFEVYPAREPEIVSKVDEYVEDSEEQVIDELEYQEKYFYSKPEDKYFFFISNPPIVLSGDLIRSLKSDYSNMTGASSTINEICRKYKITRKIFVKVKTILGWTKDDDPFTLEELQEDTFDIDDAVSSLILQKKNEISNKFSREEFRLMTKAAQKWWRLERNQVNPFVEAFLAKMGNPEENQSHIKLNLEDFTSTGDSYACVFAPFDFHYGKYASKLEVGTDLEYNKKIARNLLFESTASIINKLRGYRIDKFIVPLGSDFFHVDNPKHTTTAGTPQDMDGTFVEMASEGNKIMIEFIDTLKQIAPVEVYLCVGNHDYTMSHQLLEVVQAWYKDDKDVVVSNQRRDRTYAQYGKTMLGFTHGDGPKYKDLPNLMMRDDREIYATSNFHALFHGHLHHEVVRDVNGVKLYQMPSLSGSDRWHHKKGYEYSIRGLVAYLVHPEQGVVVNILENVV